MARKKKEDEGFKGIIRIVGKDIKGEKPLKLALLEIKGFGHPLAHAVSKLVEKELNISPDTKVGSLSEDQVKALDSLLTSLHTYDLPEFLLNHRKEFFSGENRHLIMNDLVFAVKQDIERERKMFSYRGYRHMYGQKVRGQRTKNTGRRGMAVGVVRKGNKK